MKLRNSEFAFHMAVPCLLAFGFVCKNKTISKRNRFESRCPLCVECLLRACCMLAACLLLPLPYLGGLLRVLGLTCAHIRKIILLRRHEYPTWRCCELHLGYKNREKPFIPQSAYPKCSPLPTGDWRARQQHECCTPEQLDYAVRERVCSAGTYQYATANAVNQKVKNQSDIKGR